jgi:hypothetical protein
MEKGLWAKVDAARLLAFLEEGEVDDPAQVEAALVDQAEQLAHAVRATPASLAA